MVIDSIRIALIVGLLFHKAVWEVLKLQNQKQKTQPQPASLMRTLMKGIKIAVLLGILVQALVPEVFPIAADATTLRWIGLALFTGGLSLAVIARFQLGRQWSDIEVGAVASTHKVIDGGVYGLIRHPIYTGDLMLLAGFELALNSWLVLGVVCIIAVVAWKATTEERALAAALPGYREYQARTKRFVPFMV